MFRNFLQKTENSPPLPRIFKNVEKNTLKMKKSNYRVSSLSEIFAWLGNFGLIADNSN